MKHEVLVEKVKANKWLIGAIVFFILWKFFLIHILWQDRAVPPEPDDSYNYIAQITSIADCKLFQECSSTTISTHYSSGFYYLSYRLFFGLLAHLTGLSSEAIYHLSFYIGTLFLAFILYPFLQIFSKDKNLIAWSIVFLSFYHGLGEIHGFFWVVPSFFSVLLFFTLVTLILREEVPFKIWLWLPLSLLYTFSHPMSFFLIFTIPLFLVIFSLFTLRINPVFWKRMFFVGSVVLLASSIPNYLSLQNSTENDVYSIKGTIIQAQSAVENPIPEEKTAIQSLKSTGRKSHLSETERFLHQKVGILQNVYFHWIFPHWILIVLFLLCSLLLVYKHAFAILSFYIACFLFFILATFLNPFGFRAAITLWPLTYIIFAFNSWYLIQMVQEKTTGRLRNILLSVIFLLLTVFFVTNATFAFIFNENFNVRNNYSIEPALVEYVLHEIPPHETIMFSPELTIAEMWNNPALRKRATSYDPESSYIVLTDPTKMPKKERSLFFQAMQRLAETFGTSLSKDRPSPTRPPGPPGYTVEREFGIFTFYKRLP